MPPKSKKGKSKTGPITQAGPRPRATPPHTLSAAYIFPGLHYKIITALSGDCVADSALPYFNLAGTDREATDTYDTTIQADFQCINQSCSEFEWRGGAVSIIVRLFPDESYNAVVYSQRCRLCEDLAAMSLDEGTYTERVSYALKMWTTWETEPPPPRELRLAASLVQSPRQIPRGLGGPDLDRQTRIIFFPAPPRDMLLTPTATVLSSNNNDLNKVNEAEESRTDSNYGSQVITYAGVTAKPARKSFPSSFMLPHLHDKVVAHLNADGRVSPIPGVKYEGTTEDSVKDKNTRVMGHFWCTNPGCEHNWSSKIVGIEILKFGDNTYNATIFNQRCKACDALGYLRLEEDSYVARVVYRLKKWAGVKMEEQPYNPCRGGPVHASELCEGCKVGKCKYATNFEEDY